MNTPNESGGPAATRGAIRGRGRGGRGGGNPHATRLAKSTSDRAKIGPSRNPAMDYMKDALLEGAFIVVVGSATDLQQWTFHHPVGMTGLDPASWVATPTNEIDTLLKRRTSDEVRAWQRRSQIAIREEVLASKIGRKYSGGEDQTEVWVAADSPAIKPTIQKAQADAKSAGKPESEWLAFAPLSVQKNEAEFKAALKNQAVPKEWLEENPQPLYETRGGPLGDRRQKAVGYLGTLSTAAARDFVLRRSIGIA